MYTDVHTHTTFSDGSALDSMIEAAETAGLEGLGLTDHCIVTDDDFGRRERYDLVETYERRRSRIESARETTKVQLYDAAEVSYVAGETEPLRAFLAAADFEYTIGSVHFAGEYDFTRGAPYADATASERRRAVERYYDAVVELIRSDLFDVLGHLDLPERLEPLRGHTRPDDYDRVAAALADSTTVPEINAGRIDRSLGRVHPNPTVLSSFIDRGVGFVLGSDGHKPADVRRRVPALRRFIDRHEVEIVDVAQIRS